MKHAVIIRMDYPEDTPDFSDRFVLFQANMLARLKRQTDKDFEIWVRCNPVHNDLFQKHGCQTFNVPGEAKRNRFGAFQPWSVDLFRDYDIQTRADYDDIVRLDFISKIHQEFKPGRLLCFNRYRFDPWTMKSYMTRCYHQKHVGIFLSLMKGWPFIYSRSHNKMWMDAEETVIVPHGYCWQVIHGANAGRRRGSKIRTNDEEVQG